MRATKRLVRILVVAAAICWVGIVGRTVFASWRLDHAGTVWGAGTPVLDFEWLVRLPGADARFSRLVHASSPAARIYGACGLYLSGSEGLRASIDALSNDDSEVLVLYGCIGSTEKVKDFVRDVPGHCEHLRPEQSSDVRSEIRLLTGFNP
jgi:hypothetical protein